MTNSERRQGRDDILTAFDGPAARWKSAQRRIADPGAYPPTSDEWGRRAVNYCETLEAAGPAEAARREPVVAQAVRVWEDPRSREVLRLLLIADMSVRLIAHRLGVPGRVVAAAEMLFFAVRGRLSSPGWVHSHVIAPVAASQGYVAAARLRYCFQGGEGAAELILDARVTLPFAASDRLYERRILAEIRASAALDTPFPDLNAAARYAVKWLELLKEERRLEGDRLRFAAECRRDLRKLKAKGLAASPVRRPRRAASPLPASARMRLAAGRARGKAGGPSQTRRDLARARRPHSAEDAHAASGAAATDVTAAAKTRPVDTSQRSRAR